MNCKQIVEFISESFRDVGEKTSIKFYSDKQFIGCFIIRIVSICNFDFYVGYGVKYYLVNRNGQHYLGLNSNIKTAMPLLCGNENWFRNELLQPNNLNTDGLLTLTYAEYQLLSCYSFLNLLLDRYPNLREDEYLFRIKNNSCWRISDYRRSDKNMSFQLKDGIMVLDIFNGKTHMQYEIGNQDDFDFVSDYMQFIHEILDKWDDEFESNYYDKDGKQLYKNCHDKKFLELGKFSENKAISNAIEFIEKLFRGNMYAVSISKEFTFGKEFKYKTITCQKNPNIRLEFIFNYGVEYFLVVFNNHKYYIGMIKNIGITVSSLCRSLALKNKIEDVILVKDLDNVMCIDYNTFALLRYFDITEILLEKYINLFAYDHTRKAPYYAFDEYGTYDCIINSFQHGNKKIEICNKDNQVYIRYISDIIEEYPFCQNDTYEFISVLKHKINKELPDWDGVV